MQSETCDYCRESAGHLAPEISEYCELCGLGCCIHCVDNGLLVKDETDDMYCCEDCLKARQTEGTKMQNDSDKLKKTAERLIAELQTFTRSLDGGADLLDIDLPPDKGTPWFDVEASQGWFRVYDVNDNPLDVIPSDRNKDDKYAIYLGWADKNGEYAGEESPRNIKAHASSGFLTWSRRENVCNIHWFHPPDEGGDVVIDWGKWDPDMKEAAKASRIIKVQKRLPVTEVYTFEDFEYARSLEGEHAIAIKTGSDFAVERNMILKDGVRVSD